MGSFPLQRGGHSRRQPQCKKRQGETRDGTSNGGDHNRNPLGAFEVAHNGRRAVQRALPWRAQEGAKRDVELTQSKSTADSRQQGKNEIFVSGHTHSGQGGCGIHVRTGQHQNQVRKAMGASDCGDGKSIGRFQ